MTAATLPPRRRKRRVNPARVLMSLALWSFVFFLAFPLFWLLAMSFKTPQEIFQANTFLPTEPTIANYLESVSDLGVLGSAWNTFKIAALSAVITLLIATPAAYALARRQGPANRAAVIWILVSQTFPVILIIVPLYLVLARLLLVNTHAGLIVVYVVWGLPFVLWMLQGYVRNIPIELEEAASVDGASQAQVLRFVLVPLIIPGLVATGMFAFINAWNEFFFALVMLKSPDLLTIQVSLSKLRGVEGLARWGPLSAGSVLATIPTLVLFAFMQRRLVSGLLSGGVKS